MIKKMNKAISNSIPINNNGIVAPHIEKIVLENIKMENVIELTRFDSNTWIYNPGGNKSPEIVKIRLVEAEDR